MRMVKNDELTRIKRGIYCMGPKYRDNEPNPISVANILYAPSYVSFEYALSYYGMIPERVDEITSATMKHPKLFNTPIGRYSYRKISAAAYSIGIDWHYNKKDGGKLIATAEKALCDKIRYDRGIGTMTQDQMTDYLEHDLRIEGLEKLDAELIRSIAIAYRSQNLRILSTLVAKRSRNG
ncbi:MAG: hypothetical protein PHZ17_09080 [Sulfurovum sp.]|nr:hypothetical protein [Sulfurovum sp.]